MMKYLGISKVANGSSALSLVYLFCLYTICTKDSLSDARYDMIITPPDTIVRLITAYNLGTA